MSERDREDPEGAPRNEPTSGGADRGSRPRKPADQGKPARGTPRDRGVQNRDRRDNRGKPAAGYRGKHPRDSRDNRGKPTDTSKGYRRGAEGGGSADRRSNRTERDSSNRNWRDNRGKPTDDTAGHRGAGRTDRSGFRPRTDRGSPDRGGYRGAGGPADRDSRNRRETSGESPGYRSADRGGFRGRAGGGFGGRSDRGSADRGGFRGRPDRDSADGGGFRGRSDRGSADRGGFRGRPDRDSADRGGFRGRSDRDSADRRGFGGRSDRGSADRGGFRGRPDRDSADQGGFGGRPDRDSADRGGFGGRSDRGSADRGGFRGRSERDSADRGGFRGRSERDSADGRGFRGRSERGSADRGGFRGRPDRESADRGSRDRGETSGESAGYSGAERGASWGRAGGGSADRDLRDRPDTSGESTAGADRGSSWGRAGGASADRGGFGGRSDRSAADHSSRETSGESAGYRGADRGRAGGTPADRDSRGNRGDVAGDREVEPTAHEEPTRDTGGPELPDDIEFSDLDADARRELRSLAKNVAEVVGRHLVAAGFLLDEDPALALEHARYARTRASRVAVVREAAGIAAYHAGEWAEALGELRAVRRMTGSQVHLPVMVDCERALGRPERALELAAEAPADLPDDVAVELRIVAAGARRDLGQLDAAVVALQGPDLEPNRRDPWSARLFYAYADNLAAAGRTEDAIRWFLNAAEADQDDETDAAERATTL